MLLESSPTAKASGAAFGLPLYFLEIEMSVTAFNRRRRELEKKQAKAEPKPEAKPEPKKKPAPKAEK